MERSSVSIVGAGPAGVFAALFLARAGIPCCLIDKAVFPRDKICGDGISGWVLSVLSKLDKDLLLKLNRQDFLVHSYGMRVVAPNGKMLDLPFLDDNEVSPELPPGYICKRIHLDNFLVEEAKQKPEIEFLEGVEVLGYARKGGKNILTTNTGLTIISDLVIFANGANSKFMKEPGGIVKDAKWTMTGIKTYYKGISGMHKKNYVELHFLKNLLPGYFWIFPLPNGEANIGVGIDRYRIKKHRINLKKLMFEAIENEPHLMERFKNATQISKVEAYSLPLWDKKRKIRGDGFLLAGDAANLIDPVTGEGIGHAALSGMFAARQAIRSIEKGDYSEAFLKQYEDDLYEKIGRELRISRKIPRFVKYPWLFNSVVKRAANSEILQRKLTLAMSDLEVRKKLKSPWLYIKILMGR
ncbi:MAG: geranylgeranyl reductase family protein [Bacteroidales bacterium]|nr:geranylgeranyl reductase family protein [Bacteroidales bacterium]MCF8403014.1 geranylgeranyl reductase family protein [Bacteroidales bacterium]